MEWSETEAYCHQCGTALIYEIDIPPSPFRQFHRTLQVPDTSEAVTINNYISNVDVLIDTLDTDLELLNDFMDQIKCKREGMQQAHAAHESMLSPIRRLPREILTEIFGLCCPSSPKQSSPREILAPFALSAVCYSWREMVVGIPKLWSQISLNDTVRWSEILFKKWIQRSANTPLSIYIDIDSGALHLDKVDPISLLPLLTAVSCRWRTASIRLSQSNILAYLQPIKGRLSLLESLYIESVRDDELEPIQSIDFFDNSLKLLQTQLGSPIRMESLFGTFHRLTHLDISIYFGDVTTCLDTLNSSPNLLELRLNCRFPWNEGTILSRPMPMIFLMHLQSLDIKSHG